MKGFRHIGSDSFSGMRIHDILCKKARIKIKAHVPQAEKRARRDCSLQPFCAAIPGNLSGMRTTALLLP
jgi:hypothetical protein